MTERIPIFVDVIFLWLNMCDVAEERESTGSNYVGFTNPLAAVESIEIVGHVPKL